MRAVVLLLLLVAAAETFFVFGPDRDRRAAATPPVAYQQAKADALFASSFKQFSSTRVALAQFKGKPLIVYFWATWCAECKEEAKALAALQRQHEAGGLAVIGVGVDQSDQLERFMRENQLGFPVFVAGKEGIDLSKKMGNLLGELPFIAAIDRRGMFAGKHLGKFLPGTLESIAGAALK